MEHIGVAIRPGQGPGAVDWAVRHAGSRIGGLEIIASGLEWPNPRAVLHEVGRRLHTAGCEVPWAMRTVAPGLRDVLEAWTGTIDLLVLGSRGGLGERAEAETLVALASAAGCPVVIVPGGWRAGAEEASATGLAASGETRGLVDQVLAGTRPIRIVPTSFVVGAPPPAENPGDQGPRRVRVGASTIGA